MLFIVVECTISCIWPTVVLLLGTSYYLLSSSDFCYREHTYHSIEPASNSHQPSTSSHHSRIRTNPFILNHRPRHRLVKTDLICTDQSFSLYCATSATASRLALISHSREDRIRLLDDLHCQRRVGPGRADSQGPFSHIARIRSCGLDCSRN